jgi:Periplasmic copper-binding protein (NosD)
MIKTAILALIVTALAIPAQAQQRVFVSSTGLDTNPCTVTQPCRTFQVAHNIAAANSEIDVLDPAGYGPLTITKGISIQAHGFGGITQTCGNCAAIIVNVTTSDPVTLNGLLLDGAGTGETGIFIPSGKSVQILNSVIRHFQFGIFYSSSTSGANLLIEDTVASDNTNDGIDIAPSGASIKATLSRITANNNNFGVLISGNGDMTIANSVMSNSFVGLRSADGVTLLAKNVISGNGTGVVVVAGIVKSYGDNYINDSTIPVSGVVIPVATQ